MQVADKPDELEKKFEEVHHRLLDPMESLFLGDLVKDVPINPSTWSRIIIETDWERPCREQVRFVRLLKRIQGSPDEKAIRSYMEFARCHDAYRGALDALWTAGLALLKDHQENPQHDWGTPTRFNGEDDEVKFDFLSESIIDALWPEEKSRIHFFCGQLAKGWRPWRPEPYDSEKTMLSHLMYIKNQLYPDLLECAKRFACEANRISGEAGHHSDDDESRAHSTVIFGHASSTPFACKDAEATEETLCEYAKRKTMPKLFIDAWDKELEANILDGSRSCIEEVRSALASKTSALTKSRRWVKAVQSAYEETRKYAESLPDLALALYRDYCRHPELYADDLSCHEVHGFAIEWQYPIIKALPLRLRRRLLWGFERWPAVEGSTRLTDFEKEILRTPRYLSLADAAGELAPFYID